MREFIDIVSESEQLNELTGVKNNPDIQAFKYAAGGPEATFQRGTRLKAFLDSLKERGFIAHGNGHFAVVFSHPSLDYVIKMFTRDPNYIKYIKYCLANQGNPHVPKFRGKIIALDKDHFIIRMEKLTSAVGRSIADAIEEYAFALQDGENPWEKIASLHYTTAEKAELEKQKGAFAVIDDVAKIVGPKQLDLNDENIMYRGDVVVITDPVFSPAAPPTATPPAASTAPAAAQTPAQ